MKILRDVLNDPNQEPVVRHEAAEAIGAIGPADLEEYLEMLEKQDKDIEVRETAHLAVQRIKFYREHKNDEALWTNEFGSGLNFDLKRYFLTLFNIVDPAPPSKQTDIKKLAEDLMNQNLSLFDRYRAMFSLRNLVKVRK